MKKLEYIKASGIDDFTFLQIPITLIEDDEYNELELGAKVLYGVLLSRVRLSLKNGYIDDDENVYIRYSNADISRALNISSKTVTRYKKSLVEFGLISIVKDGMDSYRIYVMNINSARERPNNDELEVVSNELPNNDELERTQCTSSDGHFIPENIYKNNIYTNKECEGDTLSETQYNELCVIYGRDMVERTVQRASIYKHCTNYATLRKWLEEARSRKNEKSQQYRRFEHRGATNGEWSELERELLANRPGAIPRGC